MIKELVKDEGFLSQPCENATADDAQAAADLLETIESIDNCAVLAANMIGYHKRIIAVCIKDKFYVMFNPSIRRAMRPYRAAEECLSLERVSKMTRYSKVDIDYEELVDGKLVKRSRQYIDWDAEIIQHGIDHCNGKLV